MILALLLLAAEPAFSDPPQRTGTSVDVQVVNRDEEFAGELLRAGGEERERLLCEQPARRSRGLIDALHARALAFVSATDHVRNLDAARLARRIAIEIGDRGGEAMALGVESYAAGDEQARALSAEGVRIAETTGDPDALAWAWYHRGRNLRVSRWSSTAAPLRAETCYENAIRFGERAESPEALHRALASLANLTRARSDYLTARRYIDRGLASATETGDATGIMTFELLLGSIYFNQGDIERGRFHDARALQLAEKIHHPVRAMLLVRAACTLVDEGRFEEASAAFARLFTRTASGGMIMKGLVDASALSTALAQMAKIEAHRGNLREAECLTRESGVSRGANANAYLYELAPAHAARGDHRTALALSLASLAESGLSPAQRVTALVAAGRAYRNLRMADHAMHAAWEAIEIREGIDQRIAGDERQRAAASAATSECYELAAELALDRGDSVQALAFLERGRARVLTDILENGRPGTMAEADGLLQARQAGLEREVARLSGDLERARLRGAPMRTLRNLAKQLRDARDARDSFADGLQARVQRRSEIRREVNSAALLERAKRLPPQTIAVEYFLSGNDLKIFVVSNAQVTVHTARFEPSAIEERVNTFLTMLSESDLRVETAGRKTYDVLIKPIENELRGAKMVLVVPDQFLWRVPFAALVDARGRFLVERLAIAYAPSITAAYAAAPHSQKPRPAPPVSLFAVGNPTLRGHSSQSVASLYRDETLGPLPDAEREVNALAALYAKSVILTRSQATERRTKEALPQTNIAHFATHAIFDDANPMYSRLLLAHDRDAASDGWLESWEVAQMDLHADLVVLSACETARGRVGGGEGVIGLSWSFLVAGARSIVSAQWKVASDSTAKFMLAFYRSLNAAKADPSLQKAQSVRDAQLHLIRAEETRHPFYWAPFVLLGDPSAPSTAPRH